MTRQARTFTRVFQDQCNSYENIARQTNLSMVVGTSLFGTADIAEEVYCAVIERGLTPEQAKKIDYRLRQSGNARWTALVRSAEAAHR